MYLRSREIELSSDGRWHLSHVLTIWLTEAHSTVFIKRLCALFWDAAICVQLPSPLNFALVEQVAIGVEFSFHLQIDSLARACVQQCVKFCPSHRALTHTHILNTAFGGFISIGFQYPICWSLCIISTQHSKACNRFTEVYWGKTRFHLISLKLPRKRFKIIFKKIL